MQRRGDAEPRVFGYMRLSAVPPRPGGLSRTGREKAAARGRAQERVRRQARVVELAGRGMSERQVAYKTGVPQPTVHRWLARAREAGRAA
jgi:DNA-directed RNA polymerase specialized sigma24 family protein